MSKDKKNEEKTTSVGREILTTSIYLLVVLVLTFLFITFVAQKTKVSGTSMYPTLDDKDQLIVEKVSYHFHDPERFDIVVFPYKYEEKTYYIKRVIGLPGESIQIKLNPSGQYYDIYIDGEVLEESYGREPIYSAGIAEDEIILGEDEYFVMGDNRNYSKDSRDPSVGSINKSDIIGKAFFRIWPFDSFGAISHQ